MVFGATTVALYRYAYWEDEKLSAWTSQEVMMSLAEHAVLWDIGAQALPTTDSESVHLKTNLKSMTYVLI